MKYSYANPSTLDYWPIATLVIAALTVFAVFAMARALWRYTNAPPPVPASICVCQVDQVGAVVNGYCTCPKPPPFDTGATPAAAVIDPVKFDDDPYYHKGATEDDPGWGGKMKPLDEDARRTLMTETAEWEIVFDPPPLPPVSRVVEDELGAWDPDAVDWLEPAEYWETVVHAVRLQPALLSEADRRDLAVQFRGATLSAANAVLTGSNA